MSLRTSANRYAKALFDVALQERADLDRIEKDLSEITELFQANRELAGASRRGAVTDAARKSLMEAVSKAMSLATPVTKLLMLLAETGKLHYLPDLAEAYRERLLAHHNIVRAEVTSAAPLSPEKTKALADSLSQVTGKKVELSTSVDPDLLGGVVARIGSTVYDGSVKTQLEQLRKELVEQ
jgi:F-type H+-transporting ATPase subunit delta